MSTDKPGQQRQPKQKPKIRRVRLENPHGAAGFGKPPRKYQFKPGQSGNPDGRPKGRKSEATILAELLSKKIPVREGGRRRYMLITEAIYRRILEDALKGQLKPAAFLFNRLSAISSSQPQPEEFSDDDQAVLKAYAQDILSKNGKDNK